LPAERAEAALGRLSRSALLRSAAGAGVAIAWGSRAFGAFGGDSAGAATVASCILTPEVTEGPYWIQNSLTRRNITEGRPGLPLELAFTVVNAKTCKPISGADVELWHCDASGEYSGFDGGSSGGGPPGPGGSGGATAQTSTRYLRGHQKANAAGVATFLTIFPGWYPGRTPHIHMKVHVGGDDRVVHTGQVFFDEAITTAVYRQAPYASHGEYDTAHSSDMIYAQAGGPSAVVKLGKRARGAKGYLGRLTIGVAAA
jgi:protocatechuate 3,4-dioxygenase beta subunit